MLSSQFCEIFKITYFDEHLRVAASEVSVSCIFNSSNARLWFIHLVSKYSKFTKFKTRQLLGNKSINSEKNLILNRAEEAYVGSWTPHNTSKNILILFNGFSYHTINFCKGFVKLSKLFERFADELPFLHKCMRGLFGRSSLFYKTSVRHDRHTCDASLTSATRVRHDQYECDTCTTQLTWMWHERASKNNTSKNIFLHLYISYINYMVNERLQGEKKFHHKNWIYNGKSYIKKLYTRL